MRQKNEVTMNFKTPLSFKQTLAGAAKILNVTQSELLRSAVPAHLRDLSKKNPKLARFLKEHQRAA